jgi:hypothetical protein
MRYTVCIWDTQSGELLKIVKAEAGSWQRGRVVEQQTVFPLRSLPLTKSEMWNLFGRTRPRDRTLSVLVDDVPIYHGLILDSDYDKTTGNLKVTHSDVRELAAARWLFGIGGSSQTFQWTGLSWRGIAKSIAKIIYTDPISPAWPLPVNISEIDSGTKKLKTFGYEFKTGEDLLTDVEEMPGGPDLDFHPTRNGDTFGWDFRTGDPYLTGPTFEFHAQADNVQLTDVKVKTVGSQKVTGVHGIGEGSEWDMVRGGAFAPVSAGLARDTKLTLKSDELDTVNDRSEAFLASRLYTYEQWSFKVQTSAIDVTALRIGSIIRIESRGDDWIADGWTEHRVLGFSGAIENPETISVTTEVV